MRGPWASSARQLRSWPGWRSPAPATRHSSASWSHEPTSEPGELPRHVPVTETVPMDPRIADYILANRKQYTREVIRQQLIDAGHDPAAIDATWAALDAPDPDAIAGEGFWSRFWLFLLGLNGAVFLLVVLTTGMVSNFVLAIVFAIALIIGALMAWGVVAATGPTKLGRTTAMVIGGVIPLVFALLIGGSCYALVGAVGPPPLPATSGVMELQIDPPLAYDGTGRATCQPYRDETSFSVFAEDLGTHEGRIVNVSIDVHRGGI